MFGYIQIYKPELKLKDIQKYSSYYCGLCEKIKEEYGNLYRLFLAYDVTYLILVLDSISEETIKLCDTYVGCSKKRHLECSEKVLRYGAFINLYLAAKKMNDNYEDDKNILAKHISRKIEVNRHYQKIKQKNNKLIQQMDKYLAELKEMECVKKPICVDELCKPFANLLAIIFSYPISNKYKENTIYYNFGYYLGRILYLIDAFDDYKNDIKNNKFNPFYNYNISNIANKQNEYFIKSMAEIQMTYIKLRNSLYKLQIKKNKEIINNVVEYGIPVQINRIIQKNYKQEMKELEEKKNGIDFRL